MHWYTHCRATVKTNCIYCLEGMQLVSRRAGHIRSVTQVEKNPPKRNKQATDRAASDVLSGGSSLGGSEHVFPSPRGVSTHIADYKKAWQKAARDAGLPDRNIYDMRSTFASRANACRASGLTIAQLLGHSNSAILPTYVKPLDENTKAVIEALDAARASRLSSSCSVQ